MLDRESYIQLEILNALTCPLNRHATREEKKCSDEELRKHPEWLLEHYLHSEGANGWNKAHQDTLEAGYEFTKRLLKYFGDYTSQEISKIILDENNRHLARVKHACTDDELYFHPEWLLEVFKERHVPVSECVEKMMTDFVR